MNLAAIQAIFKKGLQSVVELINSLYAQIKELTKQLAELKSKISMLEAKNKELTEQKVKDSHNSSKPSSTDGFKKKTKSLRKKSGLKSGGQKGHKGSTLSMVALPNKVVILPITNCLNCGISVVDAPKTINKRQVIEPEINSFTTEYQQECVDCVGCKHKSKLAFPDFCKKAIQYGPGFKSLVVYFNKTQLVPLNRTAEIIRNLFGINLSEASILNFSKEGYEKLEVFEIAIKECIIKSDVIHNDESGGRYEKKLGWFQVASTKLLTFFYFHHNRGCKAMDEMGILPNFKGKSMHDFFKPYLTYACEHLLCNAHLLRELIFEAEENLQQWAKDMIALLLKIKEDVDNTKLIENSNSLSKEMLVKYEKEFNAIIEAGMQYNPLKVKDPPKKGRAAQTKSRNLLDRLLLHREKYLAFMYDFQVPFDNNLAERDIRMAKLYMKISGCFRTLKGASHFCRIRSYISTVRKNKQDALASLKNVFLGKPFIPKYAE